LETDAFLPSVKAKRQIVFLLIVGRLNHHPQALIEYLQGERQHECRPLVVGRVF
jgi:hypothetical protein